jgi:hypothetical protein
MIQLWMPRKMVIKIYDLFGTVGDPHTNFKTWLIYMIIKENLGENTLNLWENLI